jgi:hypothetical protein
MNKTEAALVYEAHRRYGMAYPIGRKPQHDRRSFTALAGRDGKKYTAFWFDTADNSSHLIKLEVPN